MKQRLDVDVTYDGVTYNVTGDYYAAIAGQTYGPPEKCYESEAAYIDDIKIFVGGLEEIFEALLPDHAVEIEALAIDTFASDDYDNDGGDAAYDKWKDDKLMGDA